ncbi:MAG: motility associated factor glycosyltransferase family protein [Brevinema sp.]
MKIDIFNNQDNTVNCSITHNNRTIRLHSSRPKAESEKMLSQLNLNASYFVIAGIGLGYFLESILKKSTHPCIVFEPLSDIFDTAIQIRPNLQHLLMKHNVILVRSLKDLTTVLQNNKVKDLSFMMHRPYVDLFPEQMSAIQEILATTIRKNEIGNATLLRFGKIWAKNIFRNLHRYFSSRKLRSFEGIATGNTAIVIGAGPSLGEAIPYLQKYQEHAYLIACDTALPILETVDIVPDFVVTVDPQEKNALYLRYSKHKNHFLIADPGVHDSAFESYQDDRIVLMDSLFPFYPYFEPYWGASGLLASGGSVSTSAFDFARIINASKIIMVGQDLSFAQKKTHNKGNILTEFGYVLFNRLSTYHTKHVHTTYPSHAQFIKGRREHETVLVDARFILFRDWFSEEITKTNIPVIIAGMDGAFLKGARHCTISEAFEFLSHKIQKKIPERLPIIEYKAFEQHLEQMLIILKPILRECESSLIQINISYTQKNLTKALLETNKLQKILEVKNHQEITQIISISIQSAIQKALEISDHTSDFEKLEIIHEMSQGIVQGIKQLYKNISKALYKIKA